MSTGNGIAVVSVAAQALRPRTGARWRTVMADYWALTKPEVNFLIIIGAGAGFYLGSAAIAAKLAFLGLLNTVLGTLLVASGTAVLNEFIEWRFDAQMRRTAQRPLPAGRIQPAHALWFGLLLSVVGTAYLFFAVNALASLLAFLALATYLLVYTPLKRHTPLCTLVGAFPGAVPPLIGWAAATSGISMGGWVLFAVFFLWQFPHFMAIAWIYREDYARAGFRVFPQSDAVGPAGLFFAWQTLLPALLLVAVSAAPAWLSGAGLVYLAGALALSLGFFYYSARLSIKPSRQAARRVLFASIVYLPLLLTFQILARKTW